MTSFTVEIQLLQGSILLGWFFSAAATHGELAGQTTGSLVLVHSSMCLGVCGDDKVCRAGRRTSAPALGSWLLCDLCCSYSRVPAVSSPFLIPVMSSCNQECTAHLDLPPQGLAAGFCSMAHLGPAREGESRSHGKHSSSAHKLSEPHPTTPGMPFTPLL